MDTTPIFAEFPKMARLSREIIVTEKIDGSNAQIFIRKLADNEVMPTDTPIVAVVGDLLLYAGSRNRSITPGNDNFGFAAWVKANAETLALLGPGRHFGEWWGSGIQRGYGLTKGEKRFSLFNTFQWGFLDTVTPEQNPLAGVVRVVPVLYRGVFDTNAISTVMERLATLGSVAAPGFMDPEGIVVFHTAANIGFKKTVKNDETPKSKQP